MKESIIFAVFLGVLLGTVAVSNSQVEIINPRPPVLSDIESLGKSIFFDKRLSTPEGQSCADCHDPGAGFTGPDSDVNAEGAVYHGTVMERFGNRKPPTAAYGGESPIFYFDDLELIFIGGMFWDGRATGEVTGDPLADQAMGPFLNDVEQNMDDETAVCMKVMDSAYAQLFEQVWGPGSLDCTAANVYGTYQNIARSIAAYERSSEVSAFTSKFDYWQRGAVKLNGQEMRGWEFFNDPLKGNCAACHPAPLFTDFTYDNLGVPKNPDNPFYIMDKVYNDAGEPINPDGAAWIDMGLGAFLERRSLADKKEWAMYVQENLGKHKVPTLRNGTKGIGRKFIKAYMHNGIFNSLKEVVHFYNTRDVKAENWPPPEVPDNVNTEELGNLGLTDKEENDIVAFLRTLDDDYKLTRHKPKNRMKKNPTCDDLSGVSFGMCDMFLGYAVVDGQCQGVSGCNAMGYKFFPSLDECRKQCENTITITVDPPLGGMGTYAPFEIINGCITNTLSEPIYLPGCSVFNLKDLGTGSITPEVICVWEGYALELLPGEETCTQQNSLYGTEVGAYQLLSFYGTGCTPGTSLSQCTDVKQIGSKILPVACPASVNCMPVVAPPNQLICGGLSKNFQEVCPETLFTY